MSELGSPGPRPRASDHVFEGLAGAILRGEIAPGSALPAERDIADQFGVSPIVARQALHKLQELGLVRVRQGKPSTVLDPNDAGDLRLVVLGMQLAPHDGEDDKNLAERILLEGASLIELASRRITQDEIDQADRVLDELEQNLEDSRRWADIEGEYWRIMADASRNRIYQQEVRWWFRFARDQDLATNRYASAPARLTLYRNVNAKLRSGGDAADIYLQAARVGLDMLSEGRTA